MTIDRYRELVEAEPDRLVLVQVGDFFEAYDETAKLLASNLNITLTSTAGRAMAGFPVYAADRFLAVLAEHGFSALLVTFRRSSDTPFYR